MSSVRWAGRESDDGAHARRMVTDYSYAVQFEPEPPPCEDCGCHGDEAALLTFTDGTKRRLCWECANKILSKTLQRKGDQ